MSLGPQSTISALQFSPFLGFTVKTEDVGCESLRLLPAIPFHTMSINVLPPFFSSQWSLLRLLHQVVPSRMPPTLLAHESEGVPCPLCPVPSAMPVWTLVSNKHAHTSHCLNQNCKNKTFSLPVVSWLPPSFLQSQVFQRIMLFLQVHCHCLSAQSSLSLTLANSIASNLVSLKFILLLLVISSWN